MEQTRAVETIWRFIRSEESPQDFEQWLYENHEDPVIVVLLGEKLLLKAIETNFADRDQVWQCRAALRSALEKTFPGKCSCLIWRDNERLPLGFSIEAQRTESFEEFKSRFHIIKNRTPWLFAGRCRECGQGWYVAVDTVDDDYHLMRLSPSKATDITVGHWPAIFDKLDHVWPDRDWLNLNGYTNLEEWQSKHNAT